jgi:hypothetical protein
MRIKTLLWFLAFIICITLGIWQRQNLSIFLREYNALWHNADYHDDGISFRKPLIPEKVAQIDPEAANIAENLLSHYDHNEWLFALTDIILKYPQNEFLLNRLTDSIWDESQYDSKIRLQIAKRLLSINPQKPQYNFLLADVLLDSGGDINTVLDRIELGNQCTDYNNSYVKYKRRVIDIAEKAKLSRTQIGDLRYEGWESCPYKLDRKLLGFAAAAFADGNNLLGTRICDAVYEMQRKYIVAGDRRAISANNLSMMSSFVYFGNFSSPEGLELQRVNLSQERARQNRLRLCSRVPAYFLSRSDDTPAMPQNTIDEQEQAALSFIAIILSPYFGRMFISFGLAILVLFLFYLTAGNSKNEKASLPKILLFAFACFVFFLAARGYFVNWAFQDICRCGCGSYASMLHPFPFKFSILTEEPVLSVLFLVIPVALLFLLINSGKRLWRPAAILSAAITVICLGIIFSNKYVSLHELSIGDLYNPPGIVVIIGFIELILIILSRWLSKWKIVWLIVSSIVFGFLSMATWGSYYLECLIMLLFIISSAAVIAGPSLKDTSPLASLSMLFGKDAQKAALRVKCLRLIAPFIVVYWIIFIILMPGSVYRINYETNHESPPPKKLPVLDPNVASYHLVLDYLKNKADSQYAASRFIGFVMPEDLPDILKKYKNIEPTGTHEGFLLRGRDQNIVRDPNKIYDDKLTNAILFSGKDVVSLISSAMNNPDRPRALLARAKLGDVCAKQPLEQLLSQCIADRNDYPGRSNPFNRMDMPLSSSEIIPALACVSESNEAVERYLSFIKRNNMPEIIDDYDFIKSIKLLPTSQARMVLKAYLKKAADWQTPPQSDMWPNLRGAVNSLREVAGFYADREIAEDIFRLMFLMHQYHGEPQELHISPYFTIESAELLKKGLAAPNYKLRAWCVWQLRNVGYKFTQDELDMLLKDDSWIVRANTVMAEPLKSKSKAVNDKNSFVRFAGTL